MSKDLKRRALNKACKRAGIGMKPKKKFGTPEQWTNAVNKLKEK